MSGTSYEGRSQMSNQQVSADPKLSARDGLSTTAKRLAGGIGGQQRALLLVIIALGCLYAVFAPGFLSFATLENVLRSASIFGIAGLGMTLVILTCGSFGGIDLSVGSMMALGGAIGAGLLGTAFAAENPVKLPTLLSILIALAVTTALGTISGFLIARLQLAAFAVTLGMLYLARGATFMFLIYVGGKATAAPVTFSDPVFTWLGRGKIGAVPTVAVLFLVLAVLIAYVLRSTTYGRSLFAVGGGRESARLAGINVTQRIIAVFACSALLAGVAGIAMTGRLSSASPLAATGYELDIIIVAVIGGTSLAGGRGSILGTVLGAILVSMIGIGLDLANVPSFFQYLIRGAILVLAVTIDKLSQTRTKRSLALTT